VKPVKLRCHTGILGDIGLDVMGHGPGGLGLAVPVDANKRRSTPVGRQGRKELKSGCSLFLSLVPYLSGGRSPQAALSSSSRSGDLRQQRGITLGIRFGDPWPGLRYDLFVTDLE
jgi:hypothetical protein